MAKARIEQDQIDDILFAWYCERSELGFVAKEAKEAEDVVEACMMGNA